MKPKIDKAALAEAVRKTAKLRVEDVGGRKERPAETVQSCLNRGYNTLGSPEGISYILRHAVGYYLEALEASGRSIVHKDEIHSPSVERAIAVLNEYGGKPCGPAELWTDEQRKFYDAGQMDATSSSVAALRELMKEVG